jgi:hypothetical protein
MRVTILRKRWTLYFKKMRAHWGLADRPSTPGKEIHIDPRHPSDADLLETVVHEILHCALPQWDEESVDRLGKDMARILTRLGYRRETEPKE